MRQAVLVVAGLIAVVVGAYAALFALLAVTGLDEPDWSPVMMLTGAALFGSLAAGLVAKLSAGTVISLVAAATAVGAIIGLGIRSTTDSFDWMVGSGLVLVAAVAVVARRMEIAHSDRPPQDASI